jgi:hypothetical protein
MKPDAASGIIPLRRLLSERFPSVRTWTEAAAPRPHAVRPTGLPQLDDLLQGGLPQGAIVEIAAQGAGSGSALLLRGLLLQTHRAGRLMGLIDGRDSFDPGPLPQPVLSRLFWVCCQRAEEALKAADILLRDRNLPLIALDLKMNPAAELRRISGTTWYRLQRVARQAVTALVVLTPRPLVPGVQARLLLDSAFTLESLPENTENLASDLRFELVRSAAAETAAG